MCNSIYMVRSSITRFIGLVTPTPLYRYNSYKCRLHVVLLYQRPVIFDEVIFEILNHVCEVEKKQNTAIRTDK